jgi:hypothetical protein
MKLSHLFKLSESEKSSNMDLEIEELGDETYEPFTIDAKVFYEEASFSDHPYGSGTARETHPASYGFDTLKVKTPAKLLNENGDVKQEFAVGFDARKLPGWSKNVEVNLEEKIPDHFEG